MLYKIGVVRKCGTKFRIKLFKVLLVPIFSKYSHYTHIRKKNAVTFINPNMYYSVENVQVNWSWKMETTHQTFFTEIENC